MIVELSDRLKAVVGEIENATIADIGTDHAYIPIYACKMMKNEKIIACDFHAGPLQIADRNISMAGLKNKVETRLGYGLSPIKKDEVRTAVIAGMGGMLMIDILKNNMNVTESLEQLVLQPQLDIPQVRRFIQQIGFYIKNETMVKENHKYYFVMNCHKGTDIAYHEKEYLLGKKLIDEKNPLLKEFLIVQISKYEKIMNYINQSEKRKPSDRLEEVQQLHKIYMEVLQCL